MAGQFHIMQNRIHQVVEYCEDQARLSWRDGMTSDEAHGRNAVAEHVLSMLEDLA